MLMLPLISLPLSRRERTHNRVVSDISTRRNAGEGSELLLDAAGRDVATAGSDLRRRRAKRHNNADALASLITAE
jgi:hypothetical protein